MARLRWILATGLLTNALGWGQTPGAETPSASLLAAEEVRAELTVLHSRLGGPDFAPLPFLTRNASPRDCYFQAVLMWEKSNRLLFQTAGLANIAPNPPASEIRFTDLTRLIKATLAVVHRTKEQLGIAHEEVLRPARAGEVSGDDVFAAISRCNAILESLLSEKTGGPEVVREINQAIGYAMWLHLSRPRQRIPADPPLDSEATLSSAYLSLSECLELLQRIGRRSNRQVVEAESPRALSSCNHQDLLEFAILVRGSLQHLYDAAECEGVIPPAAGPKDAPTARVAQRAELLKAYLARLDSGLRTAAERKRTP